MSAGLSSMKILWNPWVDKAESGKRKAKKISQTGRGFSLIELLGVLAVMGILAAVTVPPIIRQIQQARTTNEEANLEEVARSIVEGIKAGGIIPNPNITSTIAGGWVAIASPSSTLSASSLQYVFPLDPASALTERRVYLDPALMTYLDSYFGVVTGLFNTPAGGWPTVTAGGVPFPNQAIKLYIVSSSRPDFVLACSPNGAGIQVAGNNYGNPAGAPLIDQLSSWIKAIDPATRFIKAPGAAVENWTDDGHQFLHVKVVDLRPLFCRVSLLEYPIPQNSVTDAAISAGPPATHYGAGFIAGNTYLGSTASGFTFSFLAPNAAVPPGSFTTAAAGTSGNLASSSKSMIVRGPATVLRGIISPPAGGGGVAATFSASVAANAPFPPWWDISPPIAVAGQQMPNNSNTQSFYVIKGTSLSLYADAAVLPAFPVLTVQVNSDSTFEYFNGSWTRVD